MTNGLNYFLLFYRTDYVIFIYLLRCHYHFLIINVLLLYVSIIRSGILLNVPQDDRMTAIGSPRRREFFKVYFE